MSIPLQSPLKKFEKDINDRRVSGSGVPTVIGWMLYLFVVLDALLNARGEGSLTVLIFNAFSSKQFGLSQQIAGHSLTIVAVQFVVLFISFAFLAQSPWHRWLQAALRESQPGQWLFDVLLHGAKGLDFDRRTIVTITRDTLLFVLSLSLLAPIAHTLFLSYAGALIMTGSVLIVSYGATKLVIAVVSKARMDSASAIGLFIGCLIPLVASAYVGNTVSSLETTPKLLTEFIYSQIIVFAIAIIFLWISQLGSIGDIEIVSLELSGSGSTGVFQYLPDATVGAFKPFQFEVQPNNETVVLLSRPVHNATTFEIHTTLDRHDLTQARWALLNLSELQRSIQSAGVIKIVRQGDKRYFECHITLNLVTTEPETFLSSLRGQKIPIKEFADFKNQFLSGSDLINKFNHEIANVIGNSLDSIIDSESNEYSSTIDLIMSTNAKLASMRSKLSRLKTALDVQVANFQAIAGTGLRLDREVEVRSCIEYALNKITNISSEFLKEYDAIASLENNIGNIRTNLQDNLQSEIEGKYRYFPQPDIQSHTDNKHGMHLSDFVKLSVQPIEIRLTAEAQDAHKKIQEFLNEAETKVSEAVNKMGLIAKEHGDMSRMFVEKLLDAHFPHGVRTAAIAHIFDSNGPKLSTITTTKKPLSLPNNTEKKQQYDQLDGYQTEASVTEIQVIPIQVSSNTAISETSSPTNSHFPD